MHAQRMTAPSLSLLIPIVVAISAATIIVVRDNRERSRAVVM